MFIDGKIMITLFVLLLLTDKFAQTREPHNRHERSSGFRSKHDTTRRKSHKRNTFIFDMKMPGAHSVKAEDYMCTSSKRLSSRRKSYIVEYEPHAHATTAHHILLIGCRYPASRKKIWQCSGSTCNGEEHIIYAWAKNAKAIEMPKGVGFAVGGDTGINYIVMQVHYARELKGNEKDYSGIRIDMTYSRVEHLAAIYMLGAEKARIPPRSIGFHADIACHYERPYDMVPFAFRTHAHSTARVISGYRVHNGKWKLIGIGNPQLPQVFYPISVGKRAVIHKGDILAARCTYDTPHRNRWTYMGSTSEDEMCNFYIMYYKIYKKGRRHSGRFYSSECIDTDDDISKSDLQFPADSDVLPDSMKTNMTHNHHHHHGKMGDTTDHDRHQEEENESERNEIDDAIDDENTAEADKLIGEKDNHFDNEDSSDRFDDSDDLDDRLINGESDPDESEAVSADKNSSIRKEEDNKHNVVKSEQNEGKGDKSHNTMGSDLDSLVVSKEDQEGKTKVLHYVATPELDGDWPYVRNGWNIGQVSGLGLSRKSLVVLHRADRVWDGKTFDQHERLAHKYRKSKISDATVLYVDPSTGNIQKKWGENLFYLPHGLTVDNHDNIWITDVGAHQVYKFSNGDLTKPALTLGVALTPGEDDYHFCKPTDVAVESNGNFFVADGYCNGRIMKFSPDGNLLLKWGRKNKGHGTPGAGEFNIPHSLALDEKTGVLFVADRENGRIQCFDTSGKFIKMIQHADFGGNLFAVSFTHTNGGLLYAISGSSPKPNGPEPSGFTIDPKSKRILTKWSPFNKGFTNPHDVQVMPTGSAVFVSEIGPNRVWKFNINTPYKIEHLSKQHHNNNSTIEHESNTSTAENDQPPSNNPSYVLQKPNDDEANLIPAVVVVAVLATPIALICAAAVIQHLRFKQKRNKAIRNRSEEALSSRRSGCFCCRTKKYYYDNKRGFDKLIGNEESEESEDDYFVRKGAI